MPVLRELLVKLGVDEASKALKDAEAMDKALDGIKKTMTAVVAVSGAVVTAVTAITVSTANAGNAIDKQAQGLQLTTEEYQRLKFASGQAGLSQEAMTVAVNKSNVALAQLQAGTGASGEALADLGFSFDDLASMSPEKRIQAIADRFKGLEDPVKRASIAQRLYGEDMQAKIIPLLNLGGDEIARLGDDAEKLGLVLSEEAVTSSVEFTDTLGEVKSIAIGLRNEVGGRLLPVVTDGARRFIDWFVANKQLIDQGIDKFFDRVATFGEKVRTKIEEIDDQVQKTFGGWEPILVAVGIALGVVADALIGLAALRIWTIITTFITFIKGPAFAAFAVLAAKVIAIGAVLLGLGLIIEDLIVFFRGGDSALGRFLERFRESEGFLGSVARLVEKMIEVFLTWLSVVTAIGGALVDAFGPSVGAVVDLMFAKFEGLFTFLGEALSFLIDDLLTPGIDLGLELLRVIGGIVGADLSVQVPAAGAADTAPGASGSSLFGPSASEVLGAGASAGASQSNIVVQGNTNNISGVGMSAEEAEDLLRRQDEERMRAAGAALEGAEV